MANGIITKVSKCLKSYLFRHSEENQFANSNQVFEERKQKLKEQDIIQNPERWRMLAHCLTLFNPIKKNRYLERNKAILHPNDYQSFVCSCQPISYMAKLSQASVDCGQQCLNNSVNQDCVPQVCPVGDRCKNRRFQLHQNAHVYPVKTTNKGWGLCAGELIPKGTFIMQYVGEVFYVDSELGKKRQEMYKYSTCTYMMRTDNGEVIDPTFQGNIARFINHSCDPNCVTRKWTVFKETMVGIFARKDIQENEELTFDYQFDSFKTPFTKCYCGTLKCKGFLGLGMYDDSESDVDEKRNANAPNCTMCSKPVITKEELLLCRGSCRAVYHLECAQLKDKTISQQLQQETFVQKNYVCRKCYYSQTGRKKPGRKSLKSLNHDEVMRNSVPADIPITEDPQCLKFMQPTPENLLLDRVIQREIQQIDQKEIESKQQGQGQQGQGFQQGTYSKYYNFYFELCKRLHTKMKEDITRFKFRKSVQDPENEDQKSSSDDTSIIRRGRLAIRGRGRNRGRGSRGGRVRSQPKRKRAKSDSNARSDSEIFNGKIQEVNEEESGEDSKKSQENIESNDISIQLQEEFGEEENEEEYSEVAEEQASSYPEEDYADVDMEPVDQDSNSSERNSDDSMNSEASESSVSSKNTQRSMSLQNVQSSDSSLEEPGHAQPQEEGIRVEKKETVSQIQAKISELIENLLVLDQEQEKSSKLYGYMRMTKSFNVYQQVFQIVILRNMQFWECFSYVQFFWSEIWGGYVTLKMESFPPMLRAVLQLLQTCTDLLLKNDLLLEPVGTSANLIARVGSSALIPAYTMPFLIIKVWVPKNYIKKLVGYQERTLIEIKKRYQVGFTYEQSLITDFVFNLDETDPVYIYGKGSDVVMVAQILQAELDKMSFRTISLNREVAKFILDNIKEIKSMIDPCEIRVKRTNFKDKLADIKHPFYTVPITQQEICLIGNSEEIKSGEQKLLEFCEYRQDSPSLNITTLPYLLPMTLKPELNNLRAHLTTMCPRVQLQTFDPTYPRKHLTLILTGKWNDLLATRSQLCIFFDEKFVKMNQPSYRSFNEFQSFAFHKQLRFCLKVLKRVKAERDHRYLSYWDTTSHVVEEAILNEILPPHHRKQIEPVKQISPLVIGREKSQSGQEKFSQERQIMGQDYASLVNYIKVFDFELCLNCLFVLSENNKGFDHFLKTLLKEDVLKEMDLPYLSQYLYSKMEKKDEPSNWSRQISYHEQQDQNLPQLKKGHSYTAIEDKYTRPSRKQSRSNPRRDLNIDAHPNNNSYEALYKSHSRVYNDDYRRREDSRAQGMDQAYYPTSSNSQYKRDHNSRDGYHYNRGVPERHSRYSDDGSQERIQRIPEQNGFRRSRSRSYDRAQIHKSRSRSFERRQSLHQKSRAINRDQQVYYMDQGHRDHHQYRESEQMQDHNRYRDYPSYHHTQQIPQSRSLNYYNDIRGSGNIEPGHRSRASDDLYKRHSPDRYSSRNVVVISRPHHNDNYPVQRTSNFQYNDSRSRNYEDSAIPNNRIERFERYQRIDDQGSHHGNDYGQPHQNNYNKKSTLYQSHHREPSTRRSDEPYSHSISLGHQKVSQDNYHSHQSISLQQQQQQQQYSQPRFEKSRSTQVRHYDSANYYYNPNVDKDSKRSDSIADRGAPNWQKWR